jgi:hypothetical protein
LEKEMDNLIATIKEWLDEWAVGFAIVLIGIAICAVALWGAFTLAERGCEARWVDSGRTVVWDGMAGCRVSDGDGNLIPEFALKGIK